MIILALGSNLDSAFGDRYKNIDLAISYLEKYKIDVTKKSSYYETPSYPDVTKPKYINMVISANTNLSPENLAYSIIDIEKKLERRRKYKNEPRTLDIDIIDYKGLLLNFKLGNLDFVVPHEKLSLRNFVLIPLKEIMPYWKHPKTNEMIKTLIKNLPDEDSKSILKIEKTWYDS